MAQAKGEPSCPMEGFGSPHRSCLRLWQSQCRFQPAPSLAPVATDVPEPPQCCAQTHGQFAFLLSDQPRESSPQVLLLSLQSFPPQGLLRALEVRFCLLGQCQIIPGMRPVSGLSLCTLMQTFQPILANGLQHAEAGLSFLLLALL